MKPWYKSKTIWLAVLQGVVGIVLILSNQYPTVGALVTAKSLLDFALRYVTELPVQ